jgi:hypothetical protein
METSDAHRLAEGVRAACAVAAERAWEEGGISGLCAAGRWELAMQAIRELDLEAVLVSGTRAGRRAGVPST